MAPSARREAPPEKKKTRQPSSRVVCGLLHPAPTLAGRGQQPITKDEALMRGFRCPPFDGWQFGQIDHHLPPAVLQHATDLVPFV